jgi:hypothetical protein
MTFILKTTEHAGSWSPVGSDNEHCLYADIVSISFRREEGGAATAHCYLREPVKTAEVPGFCEVEKYISFTGTAYVMNEVGKTVSTFTALTSGAPTPRAQSGFPDEKHIKHMVDRFLGWRLPENFRPDGGIQFDADALLKLSPRNRRHEPSGTNLFDATQATEMVRHMLSGLPAA